MKSLRIFSFIVFTFVYGNLYSQNSVGFKGGFTYAWPEYGSIELPEDADTHIEGFNFSIFYFYNFHKNWAIGVAPGYIKRGAACFPGFQPVFIGDSKVFLNYIEFPVLVQKSFVLSRNGLRLNSSLGYGLSKLMSAFVHEEIDGSAEKPNVSRIEVDSDNIGSFNKYDHGAYFNLGLPYSLNEKHSIFIESSFYYGLKDYDKLSTSKNRSFNLNVGYSFFL